jgi:rRNA-processing protein FCF1
VPAKKPAKPPAKAKPKAAKKPAPKAKPTPAPAAAPTPRAPPKLVLEESAPQLEARGPPVPGPEPVQVVTPEDLVAGLAPPEPGRVAKRFILLDSNALLMQFQFSVDIENELRRIIDVPYEIVVPELVLGELRHLAQSLQGKDRGEAVMAIRLAQTFRIVKTEGAADTGILRLAEKLQAIVVTNDKILRARLRAKNIPNIHLRSKAFLTVEGHIGF